MYITICKIGQTVEICYVTQGAQIRRSATTQRGGMGREVGRRFKREGTYMSQWLIHIDMWQKPTQSVQFSSVAQSCLTLCDPMNRSTPGLPVHHYLPEFTQTHVHQVGDAIQPSHPLLSPSPLPSIFPSIRVFSNESVLRIRWPKYWSFSVNISPSNEYLGLISFRMDWLDLLAVQGTCKSLLQHHSSKASILQRSALFRVQLSHPYMTTAKTLALTRQTFAAQLFLCFLIHCLDLLFFQGANIC